MRLKLTSTGAEVVQSSMVERNLKGHILETLYRIQCSEDYTTDVYKVVGLIRIRHDEYKYNDAKVFMKAIHTLIKEEFIEIEQDDE